MSPTNSFGLLSPSVLTARTSQSDVVSEACKAERTATSCARAKREPESPQPHLAPSDHDLPRKTGVNKTRRGRAPIALQVARGAQRNTRSTEENKKNADVAEEYDLPPKPRAELRAANCCPKHPLGLGGADAHAVCVRGELLVLAESADCAGHVGSSRPEWGRPLSPPGAGSVTRPHLQNPRNSGAAQSLRLSQRPAPLRSRGTLSAPLVSPSSHRPPPAAANPSSAGPSRPAKPALEGPRPRAAAGEHGRALRIRSEPGEQLERDEVALFGDAIRIRVVECVTFDREIERDHDLAA